MSEPFNMEMTVREYMEQFRTQWRERLGDTGDSLARDLNILVEVILAEHREILDEALKERVASWALIDSDETIPLTKISKEGLAQLLANPDYISNGELFEIFKARFPDL